MSPSPQSFYITASVHSILLYGSQIWYPSISQRRQLELSNRKCLYWVTGLWDYNLQLSRTNTLPISFYLVPEDLIFLNKTINGKYDLNIHNLTNFPSPNFPLPVAHPQFWNATSSHPDNLTFNVSANGPFSYPRKTLTLLNLAKISSPLWTPIFIVACPLSAWIGAAHSLLNAFVAAVVLHFSRLMTSFVNTIHNFLICLLSKRIMSFSSIVYDMLLLNIVNGDCSI